MKKLLAIFASVTLLVSAMLPMSVSAKTTAEMAHVAGEKTTIGVTSLFSRWLSESYGMNSNIKRNGVEYTAYTGAQNSSTDGSVEENYATVTFPEDGTYRFTFVAHKKGFATVNLMLDNKVIGRQAADDEAGAGVNIAEEFGTTVTAAWFGPTGYASPREYTVTAEVTAGTHRVGYDVTPASDGRIILFIGNIDIEGPVEADYPDISSDGETRIEAESIVDTTYGTGESTWANLQNKIMFYEGDAASGRFFVGTSGENYTWGEPSETQFKLRTKREFLADGWYDFSYVVSSTKVGNSVSTVDVVLHPLAGGDDIAVGSNAYPEGGVADGKYTESVTFTNTTANFMNQYMGVYKYNTTVYVPAGNYELEFLPKITADDKYKFYADYVAIAPGEEPVPDYPDISLNGETRIEAESILDTKIGTGESAWANTELQNKVMFWAGEEVSGNFFIGSSGTGSYLYGASDETHFTVHTTREFLQDGWYDFEYVMSGAKTTSVSNVSIILTPVYGGDSIVAGTNPHPDKGEQEYTRIEPVTITNASANFMNTYMGAFKYNTTVYVPAGDYVIEVVPEAAADNQYKFYVDYIAITPGVEPKPNYPDISLDGETRIEAESMLDTKIGTGESAWANTELQNSVMYWAGEEVSGNFFVGSSGSGKYLYGASDESHYTIHTTREFTKDGWYNFEYVMSGAKSNDVSNVSILLMPVYGGDTIVAGTNPHPDKGEPEYIRMEAVTITNSAANFMNTYMGAFKYTSAAYVPAGDYIIKVVPEASVSDDQYKFYVDYIAISPGEEPKPNYPDISLDGETRIEAESMLDTKIGTGESAWANTELQNNVMFYGGSDVSGNFYIGTSSQGEYLYGEPDENHFKVHTTREFTKDGWYDFEYVMSGSKTSNVSNVSIILTPVYGGDIITVGTNPYMENGGVMNNIRIEPVTIADSSANFMNTHMGAFKYSTTVYVPAGDYVIEIVPTAASDNQYKFYADYIAVSLGEEPFDTGLFVDLETYTASMKAPEAVTGTIYIAAYDGAKLVATDTAVIEEATKKITASVTTDQMVTRVKLFVLDPVTLKPQTAATEYFNN